MMRSKEKRCNDNTSSGDSRKMRSVNEKRVRCESCELSL